jgi:hypothetical protein
MRLGTWGNQITAANYQSKMLWFKHGGIVGVNMTGDFATSTVNFNPMTNPGDVTNDWATVPYYATTDYPKNVSDATYHYKANVLAGKGDPCKLVGLTIKQIQAGTIDNGRFRLPTSDENVEMAGGLANLSPPTAGKYVWTAGTPPVATFPTPEPDIVLPATGYFNENGIITYANQWGACLSSSASATAGYHIDYYKTAVRPSDSNNSSYGLSVRCVPQS